MSRLKCLFVDWHNTLSTSLFWGHLSDPAHVNHHFFESITFLLFHNPAMRYILLEPWMRGYLTSEDIVKVICQKTGLDFDLVWLELMLSCQRLQFVSQEIPEYVSTIRAKGVKVVIATDNMDTFERWTVPSLQLRSLFDDILCSSEVRGLKADINEGGMSTFFANYLHGCQFGPGESLLLDDGGEEFGNVIKSFGIGYWHIKPGVGLVPALQAVIASLA